MTGPPPDTERAVAPDAWQRLDRRMLLVHPVREVVRYIPVLIASVIIGTRNDNPGWGLLALAIIVALAVGRWFTTTYRLGADNVELRTGVLRRKRLSVPRSRIRSVDIEADPLHRFLGLRVLTVGTGQQAGSDEQFKLDALDARLVPALRAELLKHLASPVNPELTGQDSRQHAGQGAPDTAQRPRHTDQETEDTAQPRPDTAPSATVSRAGVPAPDEGTEIGHWQPRWVRYAPLSLTGFALVAPIVGLAFQYGLAQSIFRSGAVRGVGERGAWFVGGVVVMLIIAVAAIVALAGCARYLATYYGLRVLDDGHTLQLRHGLFTTRQTTLDLARLRGATVNEPLLLRLAGGAELEAVMTGTSPRHKILPQAPRPAVEDTLSHLLARREHPTGRARATGRPPAPDHSPSERRRAAAPATIPLIAHGSRARQRRYTRALAPVAAAAIALAVLAVAGVGVPVWGWTIVVLIAGAATALAHDRYRGLGHAVLPADGARPTWLITRSGSLDRDRDCLEAPGIIGWTVRRTFLQRRAGVATLVAATAAGKKRYRVVDVPVDLAWELIEQVTPGQRGDR